MDIIQELFRINFSYVFLSVFIILTGIKAIASVAEWTIDQLGLETKWMRKRREEHNLLIQTSENLAMLQQKQTKDIEESTQQDYEMRKDIKKLTDMFIDKQIDDMRWEINNFANAIAEGKSCNKDSYQHCIKTYQKYEKILQEHQLENGEVEISMDLIHESYRNKLKNGF